MKGKSLGRKVLFFAILLGIGLPFQNWFRVNVLFSMDKSYLPWTITMMVLGAVFITFFFGFMKTLGQLAVINETLKSFEIPMEFYNALPYVMTLIALMIFSRNIVGPKAAGEPYDKGKR